MKIIADNTCIRFQPRKNEADFVQIQNERDEGLVCWRFLFNQNKRVDGSIQLVMLQQNLQKV